MFKHDRLFVIRSPSPEKMRSTGTLVPIYNKLLDHIENLLNKKDEKYCKISNIRNAIQKDYEKLKSYYLKTDDSYAYTIATSNLFFLSLIFNL